MKITNFDESVIKRLKKNHKELEAYKKFVFAEFEKDQNKELLFAGLKRIAVASAGGMSKTAQAANLKRGTLYKILDKGGNPTLESFLKILKSLNLKLKIVA
jgi:probable addiction module antidote protein